jgi:hypothetical protein
MARRQRLKERIIIAIGLADGDAVHVEASADALRFIGGYSRLSAFGPLGKRLDAHLVPRS